MNNITVFSETLLLWYHEHKRELPWRGENDPYKIWISEVILQQTRVNQGWNYYLKFIDQFPTIQALAEAPEENVMRVWQGLGYYSRARNIHNTAKNIVENFNGEFPHEYKDILSLKGIGPYTAAAISAIAFGKSHFAIDGNVLRVMSRIYGVFDDIATPVAYKKIKEIGDQLMIDVPASDFTQALMEFGAINCTPKKPSCYYCPFLRICYAFQNDVVELLPIKTNKVKVTLRNFHFFIFSDQDQIIIEKREDNDIWNNLFQFPMIETSQPDLKVTRKILLQIGITKNHEIQLILTAKHKLTHQLLDIKFYNVKGALPPIKNHQILIHKDQLSVKAFPIVLARFIKNYL